jgi:hypothetical protein
MKETEQAPSGTILAMTPGKGWVRTCNSGCIHVSFGPVTLDFYCRAAFDQFAEQLARYRVTTKAVELQYCHARLRYTREEFTELRSLVARAVRELAQIDVVRRLLSR